MASEPDIAAKALLREVPEAFAALVLGASIRSIRAEDKELPALSRLMDKLFRVELEREGETNIPTGPGSSSSLVRPEARAGGSSSARSAGRRRERDRRRLRGRSCCPMSCSSSSRGAGMRAA